MDLAIISTARNRPDTGPRPQGKAGPSERHSGSHLEPSFCIAPRLPKCEEAYSVGCLNVLAMSSTPNHLGDERQSGTAVGPHRQNL